MRIRLLRYAGPGILAPLFLTLALILAAGSPAAASGLDLSALGGQLPSQLLPSAVEDSVAWVESTPAAAAVGGGFSLGDLFDDISGNGDYSDEGISNDPFDWGRYGMNYQYIDSMSVGDWERVLRYTGPWVRFTVHTDEVAENNWYRLEPGLRNLRTAANRTGITPQVVVNLSGYSHRGGGDRLEEGLSWDEKAFRYSALAARLTGKVRSLGWGEAIFESWNEPDNTNGLGIGPTADTGEFIDALTKLNYAFSNGVRSMGGRTAFSPFMTLNDSKIDAARSVWLNTHTGFDYFSAHQYDDDPGKVRFFAGETKNYTGDRPVIITEHGYQDGPRDWDRYRRQAWALEQGFGGELKGVMGYVYASDHQPWAIDANDSFLWQVTHHSRP